MLALQKHTNRYFEHVKSTPREIQVCILSDLHLGTFGCHAEEISDYLRSIKPEILILNGDIIDIDAEKGTLDVRLSKAELEKRRKAWKPRQHDSRSGTLWKYAQTVGDAEKGAVTHPGARKEVRAFADI